MKVSELIALLQKGMEEHGDLPILFVGNYGAETIYDPKIEGVVERYAYEVGGQVKNLAIYFDLGS